MEALSPKGCIPGATRYPPPKVSACIIAKSPVRSTLFPGWSSTFIQAIWLFHDSMALIARNVYFFCPLIQEK